eukprot:TRINITY_DN2619_c0_g1_i5.p1 TRINITY_DN2619_c0_g1~~TRINITY_DN2619_c0_g1_i5.p1  ORF type:complete len:420 (-),score=124.92 TRINITY_DN2619_c0_g1_i5:62-1300(-)
MGDSVLHTLSAQHGILFAKATIVGRGSYRGRNIIAKNVEDDDCDARGYWPVEWWIMSVTPAENPIRKDKEGLTSIILQGGKEALLRDLLDTPGGEVERALMGMYRSKWPLVKLLDIGGKEVNPDYGACTCVDGPTGIGAPEVPPIPCHVHNGYTKRNEKGEVVHTKPGKLEAYYFPPLDTPEHAGRPPLAKVHARLGLRPTVTKEDVLRALDEFGKNDAFYALMPAYPVEPYGGWTIRQGVMHAPGPYPTLEVQFAQDDAHMGSWTLGARIEPEEERRKMQREIQLCGLNDGREWIERMVEWDLNVDPKFQERYHRPIRVLEEGTWGRRYQLFFDEFYGEGVEVKQGHKTTRASDERPCVAVVWSGEGGANGNAVSAAHEHAREFLVTPNTPLTLENTGSTVLMVFTVFTIA